MLIIRINGCYYTFLLQMSTILQRRIGYDKLEKRENYTDPKISLSWSSGSKTEGVS